MIKYSRLISTASLVGFLLLQHASNAQGTFVPGTNVPRTFSGTILEDVTSPITDQPEKVNPVDILDNQQKSPEQTTAPIKSTIEEPRLDPSLKRPLKIEKINVEGVTVLSQEEVRAIVAPYENKESSLQELQENVADKLTELYESRGYITTLVFIPPQKIEDGVLTIRADEGVVSEVSLEKVKYFRRAAIVPRVALKPGQLFQVAPLQRSLRRINENPDLALQATLRAGEKPGETRVILSPTKNNFFLHAAPFFDNLGRDPIGQFRIGTTFTNNNVFGLADTGFISPYFTKRSFGVINGYELPLGPHGTKLGISTAHTHFDLSQNNVKLRGNSNLIQPYISQELKRTEKMVLTADLGFGIKNSEFVASSTKLNEDRLRVITPALNFRSYDKHGQLFMRHELGIGVDLFNASLGSDSLSSRPASGNRPGAGSQFFRYTGSIVRLQKLVGPTYGIFKVLGQYSPNPLVALEQFQLGGATTVRGYSEGRLIGDSGVVVSAEWRMPMHFLSENLKVRDYKLRDNLEFVTFADAGGAFDNYAFSGVNALSGSVQPNAYLLSAGFGMRAKVTRFLNARLDLGFPLLRVAPSNEFARLHFGLESRIF